MKTIKLGQIFEVDHQQFILVHVGYKKYQLAGITKYFYSEDVISFNDNDKSEFSKEDMQQLSISRFNDLVMLPQNIKLRDFFDYLEFDSLKLGEKFIVVDCDDTIYQKIDNHDYNALNLATYSTVYIPILCKVKVVV